MTLGKDNLKPFTSENAAEMQKKGVEARLEKKYIKEALHERIQDALQRLSKEAGQEDGWDINQLVKLVQDPKTNPDAKARVIKTLWEFGFSKPEQILGFSDKFAERVTLNIVKADKTNGDGSQD